MPTTSKPNSVGSLYVHIPFCSHICPYCDFPKVFYKEDWAEAYLKRLKEEVLSRGEGAKYRTIYVGGGTPSCLSLAELEDLLSFLSALRQPECEFSVEANPESLTEEKIALFVKYGVNRVSLGVQTSTPEGLEILGRKHSFEDAKVAVLLLRKAGIENINVDWMYGYPEETFEMVQKDIDAFLSLGVPHLSAYSLILEEGTTFAARKVEPLDDDTQQEMFEQIMDALAKAGYVRYEVSNFSLPGYQCEHNKAYWKDLDYLGVGLGAAGSVGDIRYKNTLSLKEYLDGHYDGEIEELDLEDHKQVFFLTNLRLVEGFALAEYRRRFGTDFMDDYGETFKEISEDGMLECVDGYVRATHQGMNFLDMVLLHLYS